MLHEIERVQEAYERLGSRVKEEYKDIEKIRDKGFDNYFSTIKKEEELTRKLQKFYKKTTEHLN